MGDVIRVLFGTETGTAEMCGGDLVDALKKRGYQAKLTDMDDYAADRISDELLLVIITATFGNGDPPANAESLLQSLRNDRPDLEGARYAVMALGDSSYPHFAQCGKDFFEILGQLGAEAVIPRVDCDGDVDAPFAEFQKALLARLAADPDTFPANDGVVAPKKGVLARLKSWFGSAEEEPTAPSKSVPPPAPKPLDRTNPGLGTLEEARLLSKPGSTKETRHYVLDLGDHDLVPGDSIGVYAHNPPALVTAVVSASRHAGSSQVTWRKQSTTLAKALETACLRRVTLRLLEAIGTDAAKKIAEAGPETLKAFMDEHHVLQALRALPSGMSAQALVDALHPLAPRLFSVANDSRGGPVELCIETTRYVFHGEQTAGVASCWFADQLKPGDKVSWYPHPNENFHLPRGTEPLILVGPGTGIAPFRGFLQQLANDGADRNVWLFFGHRNAAVDDLYGPELAALQERGVLDRYDVAWSRDQGDQAEQAYVQHRIRENAAELWDWLEQGAVVMVCGAAIGMAPAVRDAFRQIASDRGSDGEAWLAARIAAGAYREDVY